MERGPQVFRCFLCGCRSWGRFGSSRSDGRHGEDLGVGRAIVVGAKIICREGLGSLRRVPVH